MIRLVSLQRVKDWLNVIHDADDAKLDFAILSASQAVIDYLGLSDSDFTFDSDGDQELDSDGNPTDVEEVEQIATAILVGKLYDGTDPKDLQQGRLPVEVSMLLYIRRRELGLS